MTPLLYLLLEHNPLVSLTHHHTIIPKINLLTFLLFGFTRQRCYFLDRLISPSWQYSFPPAPRCTRSLGLWPQPSSPVGTTMWCFPQIRRPSFATRKITVPYHYLWRPQIWNGWQLWRLVTRRFPWWLWIPWSRDNQFPFKGVFNILRPFALIEYTGRAWQRDVKKNCIIAFLIFCC